MMNGLLIFILMIVQAVAAQAGGGLKLRFENNQAGLDYWRSRDAGESQGVVQWSLDLKQWHSFGVSSSVAEQTATNERVHAMLPVSDIKSAFFRVQVGSNSVLGSAAALGNPMVSDGKNGRARTVWSLIAVDDRIYAGGGDSTLNPGSVGVWYYTEADGWTLDFEMDTEEISQPVLIDDVFYLPYIDPSTNDLPKFRYRNPAGTWTTVSETPALAHVRQILPVGDGELLLLGNSRSPSNTASAVVCEADGSNMRGILVFSEDGSEGPSFHEFNWYYSGVQFRGETYVFNLLNFQNQTYDAPSWFRYDPDEEQFTYPSAASNRASEWFVPNGRAEDAGVVVYIDAAVEYHAGLFYVTKTSSPYQSEDPDFSTGATLYRTTKGVADRLYFKTAMGSAPVAVDLPAQAAPETVFQYGGELYVLGVEKISDSSYDNILYRVIDPADSGTWVEEVRFNRGNRAKSALRVGDTFYFGLGMDYNEPVGEAGTVLAISPDTEKPAETTLWQTGFTDAETYSAGVLNGQNNWATDGGGGVELAAGTGAVVDGYESAVNKQQGTAAEQDKTYTASISFFFDDNSSGNNNAPVIGASIYNGPLATDTKINGVLQKSGGAYRFQLRSNFGTANTSLGFVQSSAFAAEELGITIGSDTRSDVLTLSLILTAGADANSWDATVTLYNETTSTTIMEWTPSAGNLVFAELGGALYGGFTAGQSDSNAQVSDRTVQQAAFESDNPELLPKETAFVERLGRISGMTSTDESTGSEAKWAAVQALGVDPGRVVLKQACAETTGNTSIRNQTPLVWKDDGYYRRARDLGQVILAEDNWVIDGLVMRTGPDDLAFLDGAADAEVFVEWLEVTGEPVLNDNGTPQGTEATHGFSTNHRCDDTIDGLTYHHIKRVTGVMPDLRDSNGNGRRIYFKINFSEDQQITLEQGKRYAFVLGFSEPAADRNMTFATLNMAWSTAPAVLGDSQDRYAEGWGVRREGDGTMPPLQVPGETPPADPEIDAQLRSEAAFPEGDARFDVAPSCNGYPDVDTYRDMEFYLLGQ